MRFDSALSGLSSTLPANEMPGLTAKSTSKASYRYGRNPFIQRGLQKYYKGIGGLLILSK
jgi:hypothetical protein